MSAPLRDGDDETAALLRAARATTAAHPAEVQRVWRRLERSVDGAGARRWRLAVWLAAPALAAAALILVLVPRSGPRLPEVIPGVGHALLSADARLRGLSRDEGGETRLYLDAGQVTAEVDHRAVERPFVVVTPELRVVVVGTRFSVTTGGGRSEVRVEHGRVRVERGAQRVLVSGGESVTSEDVRLRAPEPPPAPDPLALENGLFARARAADVAGDLPAAVELYREHARRFPDGVLAPEGQAALRRLCGLQPAACR